MKTNYLNSFQLSAEAWGGEEIHSNSHSKDRETLQQKADRLNVPLIPRVDKKEQEKENPTIAVCGKCGIEWKKMMWYSCKNPNCPMQNKLIL